MTVIIIEYDFVLQIKLHMIAKALDIVLALT